MVAAPYAEDQSPVLLEALLPEANASLGLVHLLQNLAVLTQETGVPLTVPVWSVKIRQKPSNEKLTGKN